MSDWERSLFVMSAAEHEVHEAIMALMRVLQHTAVNESTRFAIQGALNALRAEQSAPASGDANIGPRARNPLLPGDNSSPTPGARPARP